MRRIKALAIFNALSFILQLTFSYLVQSGNIGRTIGDVSSSYETFITPASLAFGIWGIIYTSIAILCLFHIVMAYKHDLNNPANTELSKMGNWFILVNLAAVGWLIAWSKELLLLSVILIFFQLFCLIVIHIRLGIYNTLKSAGVKVATQFPLSIYLAWISVASMANMASYLYSVRWDGFGIPAYQWAIGLITFGVILSVSLTLSRKNIYFGFVTAWFLFGVIKKRQGPEAESYEALILTAWAGIVVVLIASLYRLVRNIQYKRPRKIFPLEKVPLK